ncbi:MAG TPA: alpha-amylase family glycosyl hydrolase, partial [Acidimicrobiales bacterium]|nr:alpha-amylase family glycosyl hydrolase [Acidimicrobiales bacterium]
MPPSPPRATYRVQLRPGFGFDDAAAIVGYLSRLGVSHIYCSPILQAAPGSTHGYDVVDHGRLSEELGGADAFSRLNAELRRHGMGMVVDVVPNHMAAAGRANAWWWDVLENGPSSQYAAYFDIDWDPPEAKLRQRVLVPVLGDHYGRVLEGGELRLRRRGGSFLVAYHDHEVPVSPRTIDELLAEAAAVADSDELASLADAFGRLPLASATDRDSVNERHRDKEVLRGRLGDVLEADPSLAAAVDGAVADLNADPDRFDVLLQRQNYRLAYWRVAGQELDYRRFFDIPDLIGLRTEDPAVFEDTHALILGLVAEGVVDGLRIDHPDGLRDPEGYLHRLARAASGAWIVIEKILEPHEQLRPDWPVAGTTGYDFLDTVGGLYVDPAGEGPLTELYQEVTGDEEPFVAAARRAKFEVMGSTLAADV